MARTAVKFLDRVVDRNFYPTPESRNANIKWRPIGLGVMGLQDVFFKLRLPFTSPEARALSCRISETIYFEAIPGEHGAGPERRHFPGSHEVALLLPGELQIQLARKHQALMPELDHD